MKRFLGVVLLLALLLAALQYKLWYGNGGQGEVVAQSSTVSVDARLRAGAANAGVIP